MRISDWSSDVCSSDLTGQGFVGGVVDNFLKDVQGIVGTGIHARPLPHRLQSLQNADGCFVVTWYSQFFLEFCKWNGAYFTDHAFCMGKEAAGHPTNRAVRSRPDSGMLVETPQQIKRPKQNGRAN